MVSVVFLDLDKVNPKFRILTDLLFFSDRLDIDLSEYKSLFKSNYNIHYNYFWNRFLRSSEMFWGEDFWNNRIDFFLSLNDKSISKNLEKNLEKRMFNLIKYKEKIDVKYDVEFLQYLEYCKVRSAKKRSLNKIRSDLAMLPAYVNFEKIFKIVNSLIPIVFSSFDEYVELLCQDIKSSHNNVKFLLTVNNKSINFNKSYLVKLFFDLVKNFKRVKSYRKTILTILEILNDEEIRLSIKKEYSEKIRNYFIKLISSYYSTDLEEGFFKNFKNILSIDDSLVDVLLDSYSHQIFSVHSNHKRANVDKLCKLIKCVPQITPKKILAWLSINNKTSDIKYLLSIYPDLKKLAAFA